MEMCNETIDRQRTAGLIQAFGSLGVLATGAMFLYLHDPINNGIIPTSPFLWLTGLYCPGCGGTRALHSLLHGDLAAALSFNPLVILLVPAFAYIYMSFLGSVFLGRRLPMPTRLRPYTWVIPAVITAFWITRNLPWEPFTYLAP